MHHIKEGEVLLLLDQLGELSPLRLGRVHTGRVVRARMEKDDGLVGSCLRR
jgi:hypothetical protein